MLQNHQVYSEHGNTAVAINFTYTPYTYLIRTVHNIYSSGVHTVLPTYHSSSWSRENSTRATEAVHWC